MPQVITYRASHDMTNMTATVDLCQRHANADSKTIPDPLPVPIDVSRGLHSGTCEWCELQAKP